MAKIKSFDLFATDITFGKRFKHAKADWGESNSLFVKCYLDSGVVGFGECLPREFVTGETREHAFELLHKKILPKLLGEDFSSMQDLYSFLQECDGNAPTSWVPPGTPQTASWCSVDLALLDAFGREFNVPVRLNSNTELPSGFLYSPVISAEFGMKYFITLLKIRLYGFRQVKLKVDQHTSEKIVKRARQLLGKQCDLRVDSNMAWTQEMALKKMRIFSKYGIKSFEQPINADDIDGLARLVRESGLGVLVDESINDRKSLDKLIEKQACTAISVRISKCGGLVASYARAQEAKQANLVVQIGCQVGESSLLSNAQLILIAAFQNVTYGEGCFGLHLLKEDPATPLMQFGYAGAPPQLRNQSGLGITIDEEIFKKYVIKKATVC